jgi:hypothetical protein
MGAVLGRFLKVMAFTAVLAALGPVLIAGAIYFIAGSSGGHLREDLNYEEHIVPVLGALVKWFLVMFTIGFVTFLIGMSTTSTVPFNDREAFIARLDAAAKSVRYRPKMREGNLFVYKPPFISPLAEKIHIEVGESAARVRAPWNLTRKLKKQLTQA